MTRYRHEDEMIYEPFIKNKHQLLLFLSHFNSKLSALMLFTWLQLMMMNYPIVSSIAKHFIKKIDSSWPRIILYATTKHEPPAEHHHQVHISFMYSLIRWYVPRELVQWPKFLISCFFILHNEWVTEWMCVWVLVRIWLVSLHYM